jgi:hypothetical protein
MPRREGTTRRAGHSATIHGVELSVPKVGMVLGVLAVIGGLGAWGYASMTMEGRLADVRNEARAIGFARGGRLPSNPQVREQVEAIALAHRVQLTGLTVQAHEAEGFGPVGSLVPQLGATLQGRQRVYEVRATATTRALLWSLTEPLEVDLSLRASVTTRPSESTVRPRVRDPGVSTDEHGGLTSDDDLGHAGRGW